MLTRNQTVFLVLLLAVAALCLTGNSRPASAAPDAKTGKCLFTVNGEKYIDGTCSYSFHSGDGSFTFDDNMLKTRCETYDLGPGECSNAEKKVVRAGTFGELVITGAKRGKIYWNGGGSLRAQMELSPVFREGACWQNAQVKLCIWK